MRRCRRWRRCVDSCRNMNGSGRSTNWCGRRRGTAVEQRRQALGERIKLDDDEPTAYELEQWGRGPSTL